MRRKSVQETDDATIDVTPDGFRLVEVAEGHTAEEIAQATGAPLV